MVAKASKTRRWAGASAARAAALLRRESRRCRAGEVRAVVAPDDEFAVDYGAGCELVGGRGAFVGKRGGDVGTAPGLDPSPGLVMNTSAR